MNRRSQEQTKTEVNRNKEEEYRRSKKSEEEGAEGEKKRKEKEGKRRLQHSDGSTCEELDQDGWQRVLFFTFSIFNAKT